MGIKGALLIGLFKLNKAKTARDRKKGKDIPISEARKGMEALNFLIGKLQPLSKDVSIKEDRLDALSCWRAKGHKESTTTIFYLHGGGYVLSLAHLSSSYKYIVTELAKACESEVWALEYCLAPENPLPASLEEAFKAYLALLKKGIEAKNIVVMGDSAGGGMALALLLKLRDEGKPLPKAAVVISPWTDLAATGESMITRAKQDPMFNPESVPLTVKLIVPQELIRDPYVSPLYGNYEGLPPLMIMVGGREILYSDSTRVAEKARATGVDVILDVNEKMIHVYPLFGGVFKEGKKALKRIAEF
jgi:monoterpene epsilon-lactone hydrolase